MSFKFVGMVMKKEDQLSMSVSTLGTSLVGGSSSKHIANMMNQGQSSRSAATGSTYCSLDSFAAKAERALKHDIASDNNSNHKSRLMNNNNSSTDLVGRDKELQILQDAMTSIPQAGKKRPRVVSIMGAAGTGKSCLVAQTVQNSAELLHASDGYVCTGKYTNEGGETGLARCMKDLVRQVVDRDWDMGIRRRLQEIISPQDAAVLMETFPALSVLLSADDSETRAASDLTRPPELDKGRRAKRRQFLFLQFIEALAKHNTCEYQDEDVMESSFDQQPHNIQEEGSITTITTSSQVRPLVLVLDDLQWADRPTMELISVLVRDPDLENFLLIATARPLKSASHPTNPFLQELERWKALNLELESIRLENLEQHDVNQLVASLLDTSPSSTIPLGEVIFQKTNGNPFFTTEFLKTLLERTLVKYNFAELQWDFDMAKIQQICSTDTTDSAVRLLQDKLQSLPTQHQVLLLIAGCLGASFTKSFLEIVFENMDGCTMVGGGKIDLDKANVQTILMSCVDFGVLDCTADEEVYFFVHDLVKEAALAFGDEKQRNLLKMRLGNFILQSRGTRASDPGNALLFVGVDLCNESSGLLDKENPMEWINLARYNLRAGQKGNRESSFAAAFNYMKTGLTYLETNAKEEQTSSLSLDLLAGAAEAVYCLGDFQQMGKWADRVLSNPECSRDMRLQMMYIQVLSTYGGEEVCEETLKIGRRAIKLTGVAKIPANPSMVSVLSEVYKTKLLLRRHTEASLMALPILEDENRIAAMRFMDVIQVPAYLSNPNFFLVILLRALRWSIKYGICQYSPSLFAIYGFIQFTGFGDNKANAMFSEVALRLAHRLDVKETTARTSMLCFSLCRHWNTDMRSCHQPLVYSHKLAMEVGAAETAVECLMHMDQIAWCTALYPIQKQAHRLSAHIATCKEIHHKKAYDALTCMALSLKRLCIPDDKCFAWLGASNAKQTEKLNDDPGIQGYYDAMNIQSHYLLGESDETLMIAKRTGGVGKSACQGLVFVSRTQFFRGLSFLAEVAEGRNARGNLRAAKQAMAMLRTWIAAGDINCVHMLRLLEAEHARATGKSDEAKDFYMEAIQMARNSGHRQDSGIAHECAAIFSLHCGDESRAAHHIEQAEKAFRDWGASAKVRQLTRKYSKLLKHGSTILSLMR